MKKSLQALMLALAVLLPVAMSAASSAPVKRSVAAQELLYYYFHFHFHFLFCFHFHFHFLFFFSN